MGPNSWGAALGVAALLAGLGLAAPARAALIDLTTVDSSGTINGAIFQQISPQSTGTGVIDPFVRLQRNVTEQGYNTDARPVQFDEKTDPNFTRSLLLSDVPIVNINGVNYRQFLLDINESNGQNREVLSLDQMQIFLGPAGDLNDYPNLGTKVYDLDAGSDSVIKLNYDLNHGSGSGDMFAYVPDSLFTGPNPFVYLYSHFGDQWGSDGTSDAGFEEWSVLEANNPPVNEIPGPATLLFAGLACALGAAGYVGRNRRAKGQSAPAVV
jgi:hypothetical protein